MRFPKLNKKWLLPLSSTILLALVLGFFQSTVTQSIKATLAEDKVVPSPAPESKTKSSEAPELALGDEKGESTDEEETEEDSGEAVVKRVLSKNYQGCLTDEVAIQDMKRAKLELEKMKKTVDQKEAEVLAREKAVQEELKKVDELQKELKTTQGLLTAKEEEKIAKLVETFESMSPKAAAQIVGSVDKKLAVQAMSRVSPIKLGKILSAMPTAKSSELTEALAGVVRAEASSKEPSNGGAVTADAVKGGDKNANQQQQQQLNSNPSQQASRTQGSGDGGREPASTSGRTPAK
jgi:flagellar motility protein MotE (MotC chaperone)